VMLDVGTAVVDPAHTIVTIATTILEVAVAVRYAMGMDMGMEAKCEGEVKNLTCAEAVITG